MIGTQNQGGHYQEHLELITDWRILVATFCQFGCVSMKGAAQLNNDLMKASVAASWLAIP